ncbi:unknown protein [Azorhizobium caulinodans ORS 571]|uniref:Uncharacterized protein n=1 Tax=Azorhizobium caulinodans (strain ATCC 43989 / DSM 5975 / JCM 20966 / LMG 6465 / NBRC 14845 / NCIMB 13405 / ORS 571) TaxID=438753 RepID=A8IF45_AZOC5|nr:hypothetical protein [Azorhizobium caulinodans]BAF89572.1 unknown protein [Azorhizobium caulinodans ORS 571]
MGSKKKRNPTCPVSQPVFVNPHVRVRNGKEQYIDWYCRKLPTR